MTSCSTTRTAADSARRSLSVAATGVGRRCRGAQVVRSTGQILSFIDGQGVVVVYIICLALGQPVVRLQRLPRHRRHKNNATTNSTTPTSSTVNLIEDSPREARASIVAQAEEVASSRTWQKPPRTAAHSGKLANGRWAPSPTQSTKTTRYTHAASNISVDELCCKERPSLASTQARAARLERC